MIPVEILAGFAVGIAAGALRSWRAGVVGLVAVAVMWDILLVATGVTTVGDVPLLIAAFILAIVNAALGVGFGAAIGSIGRQMVQAVRS